MSNYTKQQIQDSREIGEKTNSNLEHYLNNICPECGHGSEEVVKYFKKYNLSAYKEAYNLKDSQIIDVLDILLSSNINIFTKDYTSLLNYARLNLKDNSDRRTANSIYEMYKNEFDKAMEK